jgi:tRNA (guanosine-2'-O-)-methyltransferase
MLIVMQKPNFEFKSRLFDLLSEYLTDERKQKFREVIRHRTKYISVVLEDIYQPQNASAVLRTCDCLGIQDVHIIEDRNEYELNPRVVQGASKWINMFKYNETEDNTRLCYEQLRNKGYRIIATSPHANSMNFSDMDLTKGKIAIVFGTEERGLSDAAINMADEQLKIPMYGFTESYNISVSAALVLFDLSEKLRKSSIDWKLSQEEELDVLLQWARNSVKRSSVLERSFYKRLGMSFDSQ